jgi:hypothetical protein
MVYWLANPESEMTDTKIEPSKPRLRPSVRHQRVKWPALRKEAANANSANGRADTLKAVCTKEIEVARLELEFATRQWNAAFAKLMDLLV